MKGRSEISQRVIRVTSDRISEREHRERQQYKYFKFTSLHHCLHVYQWLSELKLQTLWSISLAGKCSKGGILHRYKSGSQTTLKQLYTCSKQDISLTILCLLQMINLFDISTKLLFSVYQSFCLFLNLSKMLHDVQLWI